MDNEKEINGTKYVLCHYEWLTGIQVNRLRIELIKDGNEFYEEIIGSAKFIQDFSFYYLSELDGFYAGSKDIDLKIRRDNKENSIEEAAKLNFTDYLSPEQDPNDYGLVDCINTGFCHLSIHSGRTKCVLFLEERTFKELLSLLKTNSLHHFSFAPKYLSIYTEEHSNQGNIASKDQSVYLINSEGSKYPESTFGALSEISISTNDWSSIIGTDNKTLSDNSLISTETQKQIFRQLEYMSNLLLYGFIATIILFILIIIFK